MSIQSQIALEDARVDRLELLESIVGRELEVDEIRQYLGDHGNSFMYDVYTPKFGRVQMTMLHHAVWHQRFKTAMAILQLVPAKYLHLHHVASHPFVLDDKTPMTVLDALSRDSFAENEDCTDVRKKVVSRMAFLKAQKRAAKAAKAK